MGAAVVAVVVGLALFSSGSGDTGRTREQGDGRTVSVLGASCAPWQLCGATVPTRTPLQTPVAGVSSPTAIDGAGPPAITAAAAVVMDEACAHVLYATNADARRPPASLTKIMTALVAEQNGDPNELVAVDVSGSEFAAATNGTIMGLEPGQTVTMRDLLYGLLLPSGNDAAVQIAEHVSGNVPAFVARMNEKAQELGLANTHFANPHGLDDPQLYTSAYDMAIMGRELLRRPALAEIVATQTYQPSWNGPAVGNLNQLLGFYPGSVGVKTGYTDLAGQTMVAAADQGGRRIIVSVLGSQFDLYKDVSELLNWAFQKTEPSCGGNGLSLARP